MKSRSSRVESGHPLDQNVPREIVPFLQELRPLWRIRHTSEVDLQHAPDDSILEYARIANAVVITFDEDFADTRMHPVGSHAGVIRLRVWPTTVEETQRALSRLLAFATDDEIFGRLVIVDQHRIRIRKKPRP
jgi:predicted nuclease of predicted toxin-antitoxin system